jgi:hypothetical protein
MSVTYCIFTDQDGHPIAVNPLQVRCVRQAPPFARIEFDHNHSALVQGSVAEVERQLTIGQHRQN